MYIPKWLIYTNLGFLIVLGIDGVYHGNVIEFLDVLVVLIVWVAYLINSSNEEE